MNTTFTSARMVFLCAVILGIGPATASRGDDSSAGAGPGDGLRGRRGGDRGAAAKADRGRQDSGGGAGRQGNEQCAGRGEARGEGPDVEPQRLGPLPEGRRVDVPDHLRLVCGDLLRHRALLGFAAEEGAAEGVERRPARDDCPAAGAGRAWGLSALSAVPVGGRERREGDADEGGASRCGIGAGRGRGQRSRGLAAVLPRPLAEPLDERGADAGAFGNRARDDHRVHGCLPVGARREQVGVHGGRYLSETGMHVRGPDRGHSRGGAGARVRGADSEVDERRGRPGAGGAAAGGTIRGARADAAQIARPAPPPAAGGDGVAEKGPPVVAPSSGAERLWL